MSRHKQGLRGRLSGDDLDALVRWGLRTSVEDARPSDAVWQRIKAGAAARPRAERPPRLARVARTLVHLPARVVALGGLLGLIRFVNTRIEAYDLDWPEARRTRWAFTPGMLWMMLATDRRIY